MKLSTPALATVALSTSLVTANSGSPSAPFSNSTVNVAGNHVTTSTIQLTSVLTNVVSAYTTYVPYPTTFVEGTQTYTVTEATTLTISDCPCTRKTTYTTSFTTVCSGEATVDVAANGHVLATGTAAHGTGSGILQQAKSSATTTLEQTNSANGVKVDARLWMGVVVSGLVSMGVMAGLV